MFGFLLKSPAYGETQAKMTHDIIRDVVGLSGGEVLADDFRAVISDSGPVQANDPCFQG